MSSFDSLATGTVLGEVYRVKRRVAEGGMGAVYEAEHMRLGRRCAVKVLAAELAANQEALSRFHREVELTAKLAHPHVVQVFDMGSLPSGQPYLVMEYLEGEDLARRLRRSGRLPISTVLHITRQIASALAATHARGIVHRDLKPANIFILAVEGSPDFVKVVDFGISKMPRAASKLTRRSVLIGTPEYMAPEQASGRVDAIDHRTDQWALATIVWEMLSGRQTFSAPELSALLYQIVHDPPAPLGGGVGGPLFDAVEAVLRKALAKKQNDRFATVQAFLRALEAAVEANADAPETLPTKTPVTGKESSWHKPTRWAALDPSLVLNAVPTRGPRRRWLWLAVAAIPLVAGGAIWALNQGVMPAALGQLPRLPWVAADRAPVRSDDTRSTGAAETTGPIDGQRNGERAGKPESKRGGRARGDSDAKRSAPPP